MNKDVEIHGTDVMFVNYYYGSCLLSRDVYNEDDVSVVHTMSPEENLSSLFYCYVDSEGNTINQKMNKSMLTDGLCLKCGYIGFMEEGYRLELRKIKGVWAGTWEKENDIIAVEYEAKQFGEEPRFFLECNGERMFAYNVYAVLKRLGPKFVARADYRPADYEEGDVVVMCTYGKDDNIPTRYITYKKLR